MMISPIGTWLTTMDNTILTGTDAALQGIAPMLAVPVTAAALVFLGARGVRIANGDGAALQALWFDVFKILAVLDLSLNIGDYDTYVRDFFYTSLATDLNNAVAGVGAGVATGVRGTAATFDLLYNQVWDRVGATWQAAGVLDFGTRISAELCGLTMAGGLVAMAMVYLLARMLLGIVLVFGPICIACSMHRQTAPIFERWMGKVIALTCLEVAGIIVLVMVFAADKTFMDQVTTAHATATGNWPAVDGAPAPEAAEDLANLSSMVVWFGMGAFALYSLPAIAYSIGTGVALSTVPITLGLMSAANAIAAGAGALMGAVAGMSFASNNSGDLSMDFSREEIEGGSSGSLPPPPPPSLSFASSPSPEGS